MIKKSLQIKNQYGIHARPATKLVQLASKYKSMVFLSKDGLEVNAKSIMGVLMLEAHKDSFVQLRISGEDEEAAMASLEELISQRKFDED